MRILVVEDEHRMAALLRQGLEEEGHVVTIATDGREGLSIAEAANSDGADRPGFDRLGFDLLILDVMLPGISGFEIARQVRARKNQTPILMLTARDAAADVVQGLNLGADDYLTKPFSFDVLCARVRAVGRRGPIPQPVCLQAAGLTIHQGVREVHRGKRQIDLTRTEYAILELLARNAGRIVTNAGRIVTRDAMIEGIWGGNSDIESNTLDSFVRLLRAKIEEPGQARLIRTVRGVGYCLNLEAR